MKNGFLTGMYSSFMVLIMLIFIECNNNQADAASIDTTSVIADTISKTVVAPSTAMSGFLNILYTDAQKFKNLNNPLTKKMTFRFFIKNADSLTLSCWSSKAGNSDFPDPSNLTLWVGQPSTLKYGAGSYFGNLVLYKDEIRNLVGQINQNTPYVLFVPIDPALEGGQITYLVIPTNVDPKTLKWSDVSALTGVQTNPSPPRNANQ